MIRDQPYDFLSLVPVIEGAGGVITDWNGQQLYWEASPNSHATSGLAAYNVLFQFSVSSISHDQCQLMHFLILQTFRLLLP